MAKETHDPTLVYWLPAATMAAPTVAEITAGTELTDQLVADGVDFGGGNRNNASQAMLGGAFVAEKPGTWGANGKLTFARDDGVDAAWALFMDRPEGYILISRFGPAAATAKVEVYPVQAHKPSPMASAENEYQKFEVQFGVTSEPEYEAVVAA